MGGFDLQRYDFSKILKKMAPASAPPARGDGYSKRQSY